MGHCSFIRTHLMHKYWGCKQPMMNEFIRDRSRTKQVGPQARRPLLLKILKQMLYYR